MKTRAKVISEQIECHAESETHFKFKKKRRKRKTELVGEFVRIAMCFYLFIFSSAEHE